MTLKQMIAHTMMLLDEQRGEADIQDFTDAMEGVDIAAFLNDAYTIVCRENLPSFRSSQVMLDQDGIFSPEILLSGRVGESLLYILRVSAQEGGAALPFEAYEQSDLFKVWGINPGSGVVVTYAYLPAPMAQPEDTPQLPAHAHALLCDYAAAQVLRAQGYGGDDNYRAHMDIFEQKRMQLQQPTAHRGQNVHLGNKYVN